MSAHWKLWQGILLLSLLFYLENLQAESILLPLPSEKILSLYDKQFSSLTESESWKIKMHGLRLAPLDPRTWGGLRREKTQNRRLVPIKRYILRASEDSRFNLASILVSFRFKPESSKYMEKLPSQKDPIFEIGFAGTLKETNLVDDPTEDRFYVLRLSAFPPIQSGIYLRNKERFELVEPTTQLIVGTDYKLRMTFDQNSVNIILNEMNFADFSHSDIGKGLVSLQTSWHPVFIDELSISASNNNEKNKLQLSGLFDND